MGGDGTNRLREILSRTTAGAGLAILGFAWPSLAALAVAAALVVFRPAWNWWGAYSLMWFVTSLPVFVLVFRGVYRRVSPDAHSGMAGVYAAVVSIPVACLGMLLGVWVFASMSLRLGYVE